MIHGGLAQGLGQALFEQATFSDDGQPLNASLMDYAIPRAVDIPQLILDTVDTVSPTNPLGAKGIGSVSTVPSPVAIANAVMNAIASTGIRHIDAPYTREKLWRSIREHRIAKIYDDSGDNEQWFLSAGNLPSGS